MLEFTFGQIIIHLLICSKMTHEMKIIILLHSENESPDDLDELGTYHADVSSTLKTSTTPEEENEPALVKSPLSKEKGLDQY